MLFATLVTLTAHASCNDDAGEPDEEMMAPGGPDAGSAGDPGGEPPLGSYCDPAASWPDAPRALEAEVLALVNQVRSEGADCGDEGSFGPAPALSGHDQLDCAARLHSLDMYERDYFGHQNPDGQAPWDRMELAGYSWRAAGENIAAGATTAEGAMDQWMRSDGHCANIMSPDFVHLGVGHHADGRLWTQVFGTPK
ncbi:MAG: hypothetical protein Tsb0020_44900 [Haliangiales bacterium]